VDELDRIFGEYDLKRVETLWVSNFGWGDAAWIKQ
jgi:hypothetical protein